MMVLKLKMMETNADYDFSPMLSIRIGSQSTKVYVMALKAHAISNIRPVSKEENISVNVNKSLLKLASSSVLLCYNSR